MGTTNTSENSKTSNHNYYRYYYNSEGLFLGTLLGIEIELENIQRYDRTYFTEKEDGSLKLKGREFTLPIYSNSIKVYLQQLFNEHKEAKASKRCSIHVHLNIAHYTLENIHTLILLYLIYEKTLYKISGNRWNSNFCVPIRTYLTHSPLISLEELKIYFPKYAGLHFFANEMMTAEFRHMRGTTNINEISFWCDIIAALDTYIINNDLNILLKQIEVMHTTSLYYMLTKEIFGINAHKLEKTDNFKEDVEEGIRFTKLILSN